MNCQSTNSANKASMDRICFAARSMLAALYKGSSMICFDTDNGRFNFRSVAVVIQNEHVLIHRAVEYDFWALPGGRVEFL